MWPWYLIYIYYVRLCASFQNHGRIQTGVRVRKYSIWVKISNFLSHVTLKFDGWPWKTIGHLFYTTLNFEHHFKATGQFKWELQSGNAQFGSKSVIFLAMWPSNLMDDFEINRAPLLSSIKLYASFHRHMWIQTGVTFRKELNWVLTCDLYLWPLTLTCYIDITLVNGNNSWKFHDDMTRGTLWKRCDRRM